MKIKEKIKKVMPTQIVREEFKNYSLDFNDYAAKSMSKKPKLRKKLQTQLQIERDTTKLYQFGKKTIKKQDKTSRVC